MHKSMEEFETKLEGAMKQYASNMDGEYERLKSEGLNPIEAAYVMSCASGIVCLPSKEDMKELGFSLRKST